jgi:Family of unknown function (DUF6152)
MIKLFRWRFQEMKIAIFAAAVCMTAIPALAHHSFSAEFDGKKPVKLEGKITKLEWTNPHIWMYLDVNDESGKVVKWQCEGGAPNMLTRAGWSKDSLKPGDQVSLDGWLAKDGSNTCNARSVKMPDGKSVFAGSSNNDYK